MNRQDVYEVIDGERAYQATRWNPTTTTTGGKHSVAEWLLYMKDYCDEALHHMARNGEPGASEFALNSVRKVTALGVACMEQHGAPARKVA